MGIYLTQKKRTNKTNSCNCICKKNVIHFQNQLVPTVANLAPGFLSASFLKPIASWSASVLWRFHRSCSCQDDCGIYCVVRSTLLEPCSATYAVGNSSSSNGRLPEKTHCTWSKSLSVLMKYDTGFIIVLEVDEDTWMWNRIRICLGIFR